MSYRPLLLAGFSFLILSLGSCQKNDTGHLEYQAVTIESDWFNVSYIRNRTYIIEEPNSSQGNVSYLMVGDERAIMLDTGTGENTEMEGSRIKYILDQITSVPVTLIMSHFHFDHNQNISEFDRVGFPDIPELRARVSGEGIFTISLEELFEGDFPREVKVDEWFPLDSDIDLGGITIQLTHLPGHADESIGIVNHKSHYALLGDFMYNGTLFLFSNEDVPVYTESVNHLLAHLTSEYRLYGAHGAPEIEFSKLSTLKEFLQCIEDGTCEYSEHTIWGLPARIYNYLDMQILVFQ